FFSSRRRHTSFSRDWSSDVCSSDLNLAIAVQITKVQTDRNTNCDKALGCRERQRVARTCVMQYGNAGAKQEGSSDVRFPVPVEIANANVLNCCVQGNRRN